MKRIEVDILGKKIAIDYLEQEGSRVHETSFRCLQDAVDIIAERADLILSPRCAPDRKTSLSTSGESITPAMTGNNGEAHHHKPGLYRGPQETAAKLEY